MKTLRKLFTALLLLVATVASAQFEVGGIYYNITSFTDKTVAVTSKPGGYTGSVVIPESITVSGLTWVSDNHADNSVGEKIFPFTVEAGCVLSFCWQVSSEGNYDWLTITLDGEQIVRSSGSENGVFSRTFESAGEHQLTFSYSKDGSQSQGDDAATVTMLRLSKGSFNEQAETVIYSVTGIGYSAFSGCSGITSVTIPKSVTSIGWSAFNGCTSLKNLRIEDGKSTLSLGYNTYGSNGDGKGLFFDCPLDTLYLGRDLSYQNTDSYYTGYSAFYNIKTLKSLTIGNSVTSIGYSAFSGCSNLSNLTIGNSVTSISSSAFSGCSSLTSLTIPDSVTSIGEHAFNGCSALSSVVIPNSVTRIEWYTFSGCSGLTSVVIGNSVTNIENYAFNGCTSLKNLRIEDGKSTLSLGYNTYGSNGDGKGLFFDCPLDTLYLGRDLSYQNTDSYYTGYSAFYNIKTLKSLTIGNSVTSIGYSAFSGCSNLSNLTIGNSVTSISSSAFSGCSSLTSLTIPDSVTSIGEHAFNGCSALSSAVIPNSVTRIEWYTFSGCSGITSLTIPNSVTSIGESAFSGCFGLANLTIGNSVTSIGNSAFSGCSGLTSLTIPNSVTNIGNYAFNGCTSLKNLRIEDGEGTLSLGCNSYGYGGDGKGLFSDCPLDTLYLGRDLSYNTDEYYGRTPFKNISTLASLTIGNRVTCIGDYAFYGCAGLTSVTIPNNITRIGYWVFENCNKLEMINVSDIAAWCNIDFESHGCNPLYSGNKLYLNGELLTGLVIPDSVTEIKKYAFYNCKDLTSVTIPNSVTSIGVSAFEACDNIGKVNIDDIAAWCNVDFETSASNPLIFAKKLYLDGELVTELVVPDSVTEIKKYAFYNSKDLTSVQIPNSVASIGNNAFYGCSNLTDLTFGNSVASIGDYAFRYCSNLTDLTIPNSVTSIGDYAFSACSGITSVKLGNSITSVGDYAFYDMEGGNMNAVFDIAARTPATICSGSFSNNAVFAVPDSSLVAYRTAWSNHASRIFAATDAIVKVDVDAKNNSSGVLEEIGVDKVASVLKLTVEGSINSYDVIQFRDKMPLLRELDLTNATVVASDKAFYSGNCTGDNSLGNYAFYELSNLNHIKLPKGLNRIGSYMFQGCRNLRSIEIPDSVASIGYYAFSGCSTLTSIVIPNSVTSIGSEAFSGCYGLVSVTLPNGLEAIESWAFSSCNGLKEIKLPPTIKRIESYAFNYCPSLEEIRIPSSVEYIGNYAFQSCNKLQRVYTYTVEPTSIQEETFSTFKSATLYVPSFSYWNYYWDDGWKRFLTLAEFNEPYEYFYVNNDYVLDEETGYIEGADGNAPDADINAGGGFIVEGEQGDNEEPNQSLGNVNVGSNGNGTSGTIIGDNNLHIDSLHIKINVNGGRWYFFAFPFDIKFKDISMQNGSEYVFRYYDGEERAKKGNGGWKDVNEDHLKAARGYIFQCSSSDVLVLSIKDVKFKKEDKYNELAAHVSENLKDASWNFTGNPYLSYYDMADMDYTAPVTVWDGYKYVAVRPGDDDYHFAPYEAFFVQKPDGKSAVGFDGKQQMTKNQSNSKKEKQSAARRARGINPDRLLVNIVLGEGDAADRTRIVFNEQQSLAYETACDASKFETKGIAQLYTVDGDKVRYAINERPADNGRVALGYSVPADGLFTIDVERMDVEVLLVDTKNGTVHDFADGAYTFSSEAGTFDERFEIKLKTTAGGATDIDEVEGENGEVKGDVYDLQGRKVKRTENGIYIIGGEKILK